MNTYFMEKSYVIATILKTKNLHFKENFVTSNEGNLITKLLQKEYNNRNLNVCITSTIDFDYFEVSDELIIPNKKRNIALQDIEQRYTGYVPNIDILLILWDEKFILENLKKLKQY